MGVPSKEEQWRVQTEVKHREPKDKLHICFQNSNMAWTPEEKKTVVQGVNRGLKGWQIAESLRRPYKEVAVLILELSLAGKLDPPERESTKEKDLDFQFAVINLT